MLVQNIQRLCEENNTTFRSLERELGIGNGVIAKWAVSNPRVDTLKKVADRFECTVDDLLKEATK